MSEPSRRPDIQTIRVPGFPPAVGPYADVVKAGGLVWISGIVAMDELGAVVSANDPEAQIEYVLKRLRDALLAAGVEPSNLVQLTNYVTDPNLRSLIHRKREAILSDAKPASTMVVIAGLVSDGLIYEVEAVAVDPAVLP